MRKDSDPPPEKHIMRRAFSELCESKWTHIDHLPIPNPIVSQHLGIILQTCENRWVCLGVQQGDRLRFSRYTSDLFKLSLKVKTPHKHPVTFELCTKIERPWDARQSNADQSSVQNVCQGTRPRQLYYRSCSRVFQLRSWIDARR